ncbi:hypothetical protein [Sphingomonas sp.]|nr:hypothetical protein [Sphingomonas sp.]
MTYTDEYVWTVQGGIWICSVHADIWQKTVTPRSPGKKHGHDAVDDLE